MNAGERNFILRLLTPTDADGDGVIDGLDLDTDGDGLLDTVETNTGVYDSPSDTGSNPYNDDSDGDGLSDGAEVDLGTNPNLAELTIIANHRGATDPTAEGWTANVGSGIVRNAVQDDVIDAWRIRDTSTVGGSTATYTQSSGVVDYGWTASIRVRVADYFTTDPSSSNFSAHALVGLGDGRQHLRFMATNSGDAVVVASDGQSHTLVGAKDHYVLYEMVFNPDTAKVIVYANGKRILDDVSPDSVTGVNVISFGSGQSNTRGEGRYAKVSYATISATGDRDGDGLSEQDEKLAGTKSLKRDTDDDGFSDGDEVDAGSDPLDPKDTPAPSESIPFLGLWGVLALLLSLLGIARRVGDNRRLIAPLVSNAVGSQQ